MSNNPYQKYKNAQYETASQEKLVIMLYNGAIKFAKQAKAEIDNKDFMAVNEKLKRAQAAIMELMTSLDMDRGGEVAENLYSLYDYMYSRLIRANVKKDPAIIDEVVDLLTELKDGWSEAIKEVKQKKMSAKGKVSKPQQNMQKRSGAINIEG
ncbi:flagellar export chaperone FliS [Natroniella acetigena]|uniref:flagellar export chaperone FliS n=1 Tax=Natroniella acetigena TaxID=52004 RepID=UPI00200A46D7|nr:flagellar export chaperone FliS [Natroniella acetigena]MCK8827029.1 flagellar export chaperone FliS [Natroniella acetigena]